MEELRREITQYQASIIDLTKWKLILIGTIGAVGLGLTGDGAAKVSEISSLILCCRQGRIARRTCRKRIAHLLDFYVRGNGPDALHSNN